MVCLLRCNSYFCLLLQQINSLPITYIIAVTLPSSSDPVTSFRCRFSVSVLSPFVPHWHQSRHINNSAVPLWHKTVSTRRQLCPHSIAKKTSDRLFPKRSPANQSNKQIIKKVKKMLSFHTNVQVMVVAVFLK